MIIEGSEKETILRTKRIVCEYKRFVMPFNILGGGNEESNFI